MGTPPSSDQPPDRRPGPLPSARDMKPTPVRNALAEDTPPEPEVTLPGREFHWNGEAWWAQVMGRTRSGRREDPGAHLLLVGFRPAGGEADTMVREAMVRGAFLASITDDELVALAESSVAFRPLPAEPPPFFGVRGREGPVSPAPRRKGGGRQERR